MPKQSASKPRLTYQEKIHCTADASILYIHTRDTCELDVLALKSGLQLIFVALSHVTMILRNPSTAAIKPYIALSSY